MKKFTKLWQLMLVLMLTSSLVFAQKPYSLQDANKQGKTHKATPELQKQFEQQQLMEQTQVEKINLKATSLQKEATSLQKEVIEQGKTPIISPVKLKPVIKPYQSPKGVLYSQMVASGGGGSCQDFEAANDAYDAAGADDFTVTGGPWNVQKISWIGSNTNSVNGPGFNIEFYTDNAGMPGTLISSYPDNFTTADGAGTGPYTYTSYLPAPEAFADGTYWIVIQARWDFGTWGQFYWGYADPATTYGAEAVWQNPGDGFGTGFTTWTGINTVWPGSFDFTFELADDAPPACVDPSVLWALDFTSTSATLGWTENGGAASWDIEYGPAGFVPGTGTTVNGVTNPYNLTGLSTGTDYDWYVRADCGAGSYSGWVMSGFRLPDYFASITPTTTCQTDAGSFLAGGMAWYTVTMDINSEYNFSVCDLDASCPGAMPVADGDFYLYDTDGTTLLWYWDGQSGCSWDASTWGTPYESWNPPATGDYYLRIEDYYGTNADNFTLGYISAAVATCPAPSAQVETNITTTSADLGWTENGGAGAWDIEYGLSGFTPTGTGTGTTTNPTNITGLTPGTAYDWYVRANCDPFGGTDYSTWTGPHTFTTACTLVPPPGYISESETCGDDTNGGCNMATPAYEPVPAAGGTILGTTWADGGTRDTDWYELVLPATSTVVLTASADALIIYGPIADASGNIVDLTCADAGSIAPNNNADACTETSLDLGELSAGTYWFFVGMTVFEGYPCDVNYYITFDITEIPCPAPTDLGVDNMTPTTADLVWTSNSGLSNLQFGLAGFTIDVDPIVSVTGVTSPYGVTGLVSGTDYEFYVMDDCTGTTSAWVGPYAFTGIYPPPANDECVNAVAVNAPYPVTGIMGTTLGATESCPTYLPMPSGEVWYAIELPYAYNQVVVSYCGDALMNNGWVTAALGACSCDGADYVVADSWNFAAPCVTDLTWNGIAGPTTLYYPVATGDFQENFTLDVNVIEGYGVSGTVTYGGGAPIDVGVNLYDAVPAQVGTTVSTAAGLYAFGPLADGDYNLEGFTYKVRGGTDVLDANMIRDYILGAISMTPLQILAADVDVSTTVDNLDYNLIRDEILGSGGPWAAPDWVFDDPAFTMAGANMNVDMQTLCSGDPDGSYSFPAGFNSPPGATCASAVVIGSIPYNEVGLTTCGFGDDYTDPCGSSYMNGEDFVYEFTPGSDISIDIALTNTDTWTGVFIIEGCPDVGTCVASATSSGGNPFLANTALTAGTTYYIVVSTWPSPDCTPFDIDITVAAAGPANDDCASAEVIGIVTDQPFNTAPATASGLGTCMTSPDLWYVYTATADGTLDVDLCGSGYDTKLAVYDGNCAALNELGCNDDDCGLQSALYSIPVLAGVDYYIQVGGYSSNTGSGDITVVFTP